MITAPTSTLNVTKAIPPYFAANYYYGIHPAEVRRGVTDYQAGSALIPEVGVSLTRPINASHHVLPNKISDSPIVDSNRTSAVLIGLSRKF